MTDTPVDDPRPATLPAPPPAPVTEGLPDLVRWSEGMLLAPQHLQQNDVFWQEQLRFRLAQVVAHPWGVGALELDPMQLRAGRIALRRLECLMPDGTPVVFPGSYTQALEADAGAALAAAGTGAVRVSLVLPARSQAASRRDGSLRRYDAVAGAMAIDEDTGMNTVAVDRMRPRIGLWVGEQIPAQYVSCPLLELGRRSDTGAIELRSYHPPMLRWQAADFLQGASLRRRLQLVADALWTKLRELAGQRSDDGPQSDTAPGAESARRLASVLPAFTLLAGRPQARPEEVYDSLAQLVGVMAGFGANPIPPVLEAYQHANCEPQFRRALDYVVRKLSYLQGSHELLPFDMEGPERHARQLPAHPGEVLVELRLPDARACSASDRAAFEAWMRDACIATDSLLPAAQRARLSARAHLLEGHELSRRQIRASGAVFLVRGEVVEIDGRPQNLVMPGGRLVIQGHAGGAGMAPAAVFLHVPRRSAAPRTAA